MDPLALVEHSNERNATTHEKNTNENKDGGSQCNSGVVSAMQVGPSGNSKRPCVEEHQEAKAADEDTTKRRKKKDNDEKEPMAKSVPMGKGATGRMLTGTKLPGPASKTGATPIGKSATPQTTNKAAAGSSGKGSLQSPGRWGGAAAKTNASNAHQGGKSSGATKGGCDSQAGKQDRRSPVASPVRQPKDGDGDGEDQKNQESSAPKVPPLKIVIPGGASGSASRNEQEEGATSQRSNSKGRCTAATLPYVKLSTSTDFGLTSETSDHNSEEKRPNESTKAGQRVLRSHRTNDGEKEKDSRRSSPQKGAENRSGTGQTRSLSSNKSPHPSGSGQDSEPVPSTSSSIKSEAVATPGPSVELHPRKRKIKPSKETCARAPVKNPEPAPETSTSALAHNVTHSNPYQMYIHIRKQIACRQKGLFPVKPKPPKDFNKYLMNRCTYTLQGHLNPEPRVLAPADMPPAMLEEYTAQEKERTRLRIQHLVEKEKLVLAVEQEILRVHGRAERAVANQAVPFSVCTILRDNEVYNLVAPEQEEKRNAQRSRCNGRQINSWLQEVDDKWEKIKEGMLRRQHTEAETLHAVQMMSWEWKLKEVGLCDHKTSPQIDLKHVPQIHVSNFDLPA